MNDLLAKKKEVKLVPITNWIVLYFSLRTQLTLYTDISMNG